MKVNAWNRKKIIRTKIQWSASQLTRQLPSEWVVSYRWLGPSHSQPIFYSWTIKTVLRKIFGAMRLFIFCPTSPVAHFFSSASLRSHRIQLSQQRRRRRRQQRRYLWRFFFNIFTFLVFGATFVEEKFRKKKNEIPALPLIWITKRRWKTRLANARASSYANGVANTMMSEWIVKKCAHRSLDDGTHAPNTKQWIEMKWIQANDVKENMQNCFFFFARMQSCGVNSQ